MKFEICDWELGLREVAIYWDGEYAYCYSNHGPAYGGIREKVVDCSGVEKDDLPDYLERYAGKSFGDYLRRKNNRK